MLIGEASADLGLPLVSIIVPAYNAQRYLAATLDSVLAQTYPHFEVLVVDDGSSDATPVIAESYAQRDVRVRWWRQENAGVGAARNAAIAQAAGRYIAPIDADDLWHPEKIAAQVAEMERGSSNIGFVYCWSRVIGLEGQFLHFYPPCSAAGEVLLRHAFRNFLHNASVPLFRSSALAAVGGYATRAGQDGAQGCEDWDLTLRIAEKYQVAVAAQYLVDYREVPSGMSFGGKGMARSFAYLQAGLQRRNPDLPMCVHRWAEGFFHLYLARKSHQAQSPRDALDCLQRAFLTDPAVAFTPQFYRVLFGSGFRLFFPRPPAAVSRQKRTDPSAPAVTLQTWLWSLFSRIEQQRWSQLTAQEGRE